MGERADKDTTHIATTARDQKAAQTTGAPKPSSGGLAVPDKFDLGDQAVGTAHVSDLFAWNQEHMQAAVSVRYEGSPMIALMSAPQWYRPTSDGFDPNASIKLAFTPTTKGHHHGTVTIDASWVGAPRAPSTTKVAIVAASHDVGGADVVDEEAAVQHAETDKRTRAEEQRAIASAEAAREARLDRDELPGSPGNRERLRDASADVSDAMHALILNRNAGVTTARGEASKFVKAKPHYHPSLLETLAFAALDAATAGIAGALGKALEGALLKEVSVAAHSKFWTGAIVKESKLLPSKVLTAFFTDSVKDLTKQAGKGATAKLKTTQAGDPAVGDSATEAPDLSSTDPLLAFFQKEETAIVADSLKRATAVGTQARGFLEPMLATDPKRAISIMRGMKDSVTTLAMSNESANKQAEQSVLHWARYVADTSLGVVAPGANGVTRSDPHGLATADIQSANHAPGERGQMRSRPGLVDIQFEADMVDARKPVRIVGMRIDGVSKPVRDRMLRNLGKSPMPIRAYCNSGGTRIEVVTDEAGNIAFADESGAPGMPGRWFERRSNDPHGGRDAALRAAGTLLSELISTAATVTVGDHSQVGHDSED